MSCLDQSCLKGRTIAQEVCLTDMMQAELTTSPCLRESLPLQSALRHFPASTGCCASAAKASASLASALQAKVGDHQLHLTFLEIIRDPRTLACHGRDEQSIAEPSRPQMAKLLLANLQEFAEPQT